MAFVICPLGAFLGCLLSASRKGLRDAYDAVIFQLLIKPLARMPLSDNFLARRIAGPGIASTYYYQISTEQALAALETAMDLDRLITFHVSIIQKEKKKENVLKTFKSIFAFNIG